MKRLLLILLLIPSLAWATDIVPDIDVLPGTTVEVGEEVFFSASDTTYAPSATLLAKARYEWDFGDGYSIKHDMTTATVRRSGVAVIHYFMAPDTYTVTMTTKIYAGTNVNGDPYAFVGSQSPGTGLGCGTTKTNVGHGQFKYIIGGTTYTLAANAVGVATGEGTIPKNMQGAIVLDVGSHDETVDVTLVTNGGAGYTYSSAATATIAAIPAVAENHVRIGYIIITGTTKAFTFGTTEFDDPGVTFSIKPSTYQLIGTSIFTFDVGGTIYTLPSNTIGYAIGDDVIPDGKHGAIALDVGTDLAVHVTEATNNATGYTTIPLAIAGLPAVAENHARLGYIVISPFGENFTSGLSGLAYNSKATVRYYTSESTPLDTTSTTAEITVTGTQPLDNFEVQHAPFRNRTKQYLYVQVPSAYQGGTTQLKISLIDTTADPDVTTTLYTKTSNLDAEEAYLFDHTTLTASHDYVIQTQLLDVNGDQVTDGSKGGIWREKFTNPASTPTVSINENNAFVIGGNTVFPIAAFMINTNQFSQYITNMGVNSAHTVGYYATHNSTNWGTFCTAAAAANIYCMGPNRGNYALDASIWTPYLANRWKFNHDPDVMATYVSDNKNNAGLFAWQWQDEPNMGGKGQQVCLAVQAAWAYIAHADDPNHPVMHGYYGADWGKYLGESPRAWDYLGSHDYMGGKKWIPEVIGFDIYPITYFRAHPCLNSADMGMIASYLDDVDRFIRLNSSTGGNSLTPFTPAINPSDRNVGLTPVHTADEVYNENWLNVIHGAKGLLAFAYFDPTSIRWDAMKKFANQMNVAQSPLPAFKDIALLAPSTRTVTDDSNSPLDRVDFIARDYGSELWIFSARVTEPDPVSPYLYQGTEPTYTGSSRGDVTTFTVQNLLATDTVTVVGENRTISHGARSFSDQFAKHAVHIYRIITDTPAGDATAPTVDAFEIPSTYVSTTVPITTFLCSDAVGVSHYLVNEVATTPSGSDAGWSATKQTTYAFDSTGEKTLYAWCKDAAGNISASKNDTTTITIPSYTVSLSIAEGCLVSPATSQSVPSGDTASFSFSADTGYYVVTASGCGGTWSATPYETGAVTENCTVTFSCNPNVNRVVTPSVGTGCYITPSDAQDIPDGESTTFIMGALYGYTLQQYGGCGGTLDGNKYTTDYVSSDCTVYAVCGGHFATISGTAGTGTMTFGTGGDAPSGCNEVTDKVGNTATDAAPPGIAANVAWCQPFTPTCYGTLKKAYAAHVRTSVSSAKVCVYSDDGDSIANSGDLKMGCSGDITSGITEWASSDMDGGTLVSGNYWVCLFVKSDAANAFEIDTTATTYPLAYKTASGFYASPPANLNGLTTSTGRGMSLYVTIGN